MFVRKGVRLLSEAMDIGAMRRNMAAATLLALLVHGSPASAADWLPIAPEELAMTSEPLAPGAHAILLYVEEHRDDEIGSVKVYERLKILSEEGRKYADIQIPYEKRQRVRGLEARTIRPDGVAIEFDGEIYDKVILKGRSRRISAKTFTLSDIQVGSIIEYKYRLDSGYIFDSRWVLNKELFTKRAKYSLYPSPYYSLTYSWPNGLPAKTEPPRKKDGRIVFEASNLPAFVEEDNMPPPNELRGRIDFIYGQDDTKKGPDEFWKRFAKQRYSDVRGFINEERAMKRAVAEIVAEGDSPEAKLRKLYARAQKIRNISFEKSKTEEELRREGIKEVRNVANIWERGYGDAESITWLMLGLARAAGFDAHPVLISTRDDFIFNKAMMNPYTLNTNVVLVRLDGKDIYLDPGMAFIPFGMLPWSETGVAGLVLNKEGGAWITTPSVGPEMAVTRRKAEFKLDETGALTGKVAVTYNGLEAHWRRLQERHSDEVRRKQFLEDSLARDIPIGISATLTKQPDWTNSEEPLVAEFDVTMAGWAAGAGQRVLLPSSVFSERESGEFKSETRVHHLYFEFPFQSIDDVTIEMPDGWRTSGAIPATTHDLGVMKYVNSVEQSGSALHLKRSFSVNTIFLDKKFYDRVRNFYQHVRSSDSTQVVIGITAPPAVKRNKK